MENMASNQDLFEEDLEDLWSDGFLQRKSNQTVEAILEANDGFVGLCEETLQDFLAEKYRM